MSGITSLPILPDVRALKRLQAETAAELDALLPALLDRLPPQRSPAENACAA